MEWVQSISRAIDYMETRITEEMTCAAAGWHWLEMRLPQAE